MRYDCFISYRHGAPDSTIASELYAALNEFGFKAVWDGNFAPNQTFLHEMARCVVESRFTICLLSKRYLESGNTCEEAVMTKVLDNRERQRRLVPVYIEPCDTPLWLYNLVGIRLYESTNKSDSLARLFNLLQDGAISKAAQTKNAKSFWDHRPTQLAVVSGALAATYIALEVLRGDGNADSNLTDLEPTSTDESFVSGLFRTFDDLI
jgi:hypothetical protein